MSGSGSAAFAIRSGRTSSSVSSIAPSFLADEGNEANRAEGLLFEASVVAPGHLDQFLHPAQLTDRHDDAPVGGELFHERRRDVAAAGSGNDRIEWRSVRPAFRSVALDDLDIVVAEALQPLP